MVVQDFGVFAASANGNLSGRSPSILLSQDRSVAQTSHWDVCCLRKRELVGSQPLHLAIARPFCRLKAPLGLSLLHFVSQTGTCRSETPPFCLRKNVLSLKHPTGVFVANANANLSERNSAILRCAQDRSVAQTSHWDVCCLRKREVISPKSGLQRNRTFS